jgi:hypothetical protein
MNASEQTNDVWELSTTPYTKVYGSGKSTTFQMPTMKRKSDGFTLIREKCTREWMETFKIQEELEEFGFYAQRWDFEKDDISDTYIVKTKLRDRDWVLSKNENSEMIIKHAKDIEAGLLYFSTIEKYNTFPVKKVLFDVAQYPDSKLIKVRDL